MVALSPGWVRTHMGGTEAELAPEESANAVANTILKLDLGVSGCLLDRFGHNNRYA